MLPDRGAMGIDSCTWPASHRRATLTPARLRLKEERKRIIRALDAKYRTIDDHERGMLRFVLIRNNLRRLQREAREEKLARHRNNLNGSKASNLSPSCLSSTRSLSPTSTCDYGYVDSLSPSYGGSAYSLFGDDPPAKKQRLFFDDDNDKENEMEVDDEQLPSDEDESKSAGSPCRPVDDAQEILRDLYESCVSEGITPRTTSNACSSDGYSQQTSLSLSMSASSCVSSNINSSSSSSSSSSCNNSTNCNSSDCGSDWARHSQYPFNCGQSSLLGNDLQSVVFHSLITSLES